jgi:hypothetical protein
MADIERWPNISQFPDASQSHAAVWHVVDRSLHSLAYMTAAFTYR